MMRDEVSEVVGGPMEPAAIQEPQVADSAGGISIQCQFCVGRNFRRSRWRKGDMKQLLLMRYPVRCLRCSQRQWVSFSVAGISVPSHIKHIPERAGSKARRPPASAASEQPTGEGSR